MKKWNYTFLFLIHFVLHGCTQPVIQIKTERAFVEEMSLTNDGHYVAVIRLRNSVQKTDHKGLLAKMHKGDSIFVKYGYKPQTDFLKICDVNLDSTQLISNAVALEIFNSTTTISDLLK